MQQSAATPAQTASSILPVDFAGARRWLWRALTIMIVGAWAGATWDRIWHTTVPFDSFWSPPHLVIYVTVAGVAFLIMGMVFTDHIRHAFGRGFDVKILPFKVPGALVLLGGGMVALGFAGSILDNAWHTAFGLNETGWSFPHAMIGWSLLLVSFGFMACRLAMEHVKRTPWMTKLLIGSIIGMMIMGQVTGPIGSNRTPESVDFFFTYIPTLAIQDSAQHVYRIYETWNLNRTHPLLLILAPLGLGIVLGLLRKYDSRWWMTFLFACLLLTFDAGNRDWGDILAQLDPLLGREANWRALPVVIPTIIILLLMRLRVSERVAYGIAGAVFALHIHSIWGDPESAAWLLAFVAIPAILVGRSAGERIYAIVAQPWSWKAVLPLIGSVVLFPLLTGIVDLALRLGTP
jgi:hypothetical protein